MGNPKTPSKVPGAGKQRTISSFFAPKQQQQPPAVAVAKSSSFATPASKDSGPAEEKEESGALGLSPGGNDEEPRARGRVSQKRILEDADGEEASRDDDDYYAPPGIVAKKLKRSPEPEMAGGGDGETESVDKPMSPPAAPPRKKEAVASARAGKYLYNPSADAMDMDSEPDQATKRRKQKLHEKFVKKLGKPGSILEVRGAEAEEGLEENDADEPEEDEPGPIAKKFGGAAKGKAAAKGGKKLTPMERQVVDIKRKHPDTVLVVEVGYKFRFFGDDARIASQVLSIMCIPGKMRFDEHPSEAHLDRFASASIPIHRLHVHVKRLVAAGYKVGVVRQIETAALKAAGDNKNAPFERKLTNLYTKGTYIDDVDGIDGDLSAGAGSGGASGTGFMLCITEKPGGGTGADEKAHVGIVAVQPATGDVIYDEFDDGFMRSEIETRLLHSEIAPIVPRVRIEELTGAVQLHPASS